MTNKKKKPGVKNKVSNSKLTKEEKYINSILDDLENYAMTGKKNWVKDEKEYYKK